MEIYSADGITLGVKEFTRTVTTPDGKKERVTYHEGDPEFDAYVETQRKQLEPALPIDFVRLAKEKAERTDGSWKVRSETSSISITPARRI